VQLFDQHETLVVVDFETTGMSPEQGDRVIEIGAVMLRGNDMIDRFESLIQPAFLVSREIETLTGITNSMLQQAPDVAEVMPRFIRFIGNYPLVAHNASFDQKFLEAELDLFGKPRPLNFGCTLQLARRIYPDLLNYKLETLVRYKNLPRNGRFHRALADAEMTALLWLSITADLKQRYGFTDLPFDLLKKTAKTSREQVAAFLQQAAQEARQNQIGTTGNLFG
jgi:DNA polymerase-3 subunit epsilon